MKSFRCQCCNTTINLEKIRYYLDPLKIKRVDGYISADADRQSWKAGFEKLPGQDDDFYWLKEALSMGPYVDAAPAVHIVAPSRDFVPDKNGNINNHFTGAKTGQTVEMFRLDVEKGKPCLRFTEEFCRTVSETNPVNFPVITETLCPQCYCLLDGSTFDPDCRIQSCGLIGSKSNTKSVTLAMADKFGMFGHTGGRLNDEAIYAPVNPILGSSAENSNALLTASKEIDGAGLLPDQTSTLWNLAIPIHIKFDKYVLSQFTNDFSGEQIGQVWRKHRGLCPGDLVLETAEQRLQNLDSYIILCDVQELMGTIRVDEQGQADQRSAQSQNISIGHLIEAICTIIKADGKQKNCVFTVTKCDLLFDAQTAEDENGHNMACRMINALPVAARALLFKDNPRTLSELNNSRFDIERHQALQPYLLEWAEQFVENFHMLKDTFRKVDVVFTAPLGRDINSYSKTGSRELKTAFENYYKESLGLDPPDWNGMRTMGLLSNTPDSFLRPFYPMDPISAAIVSGRPHVSMIGEITESTMKNVMKAIEQAAQQPSDLPSARPQQPAKVRPATIRPTAVEEKNPSVDTHTSFEQRFRLLEENENTDPNRHEI